MGSITDNSNVGAYSYANTGNANPDAPTSVAGTAYTYDANGNLTQGENGNTYGYDYRNRMDSFSNGSVNVSYGYNANDNQVYARTLNSDGSSATTTYVGKYYQVGTNSNTNTWTTTTDNIWAGNTLLATVQKGTEVATSTSYVYPDQLNSVNVVADSSGNLLQTLDYYPYGSKRISSGSSPVTRQYLSQQHDATNDLTNLNARYYNQRTGQFLSQDPVFLGDPNQQNLSDPQSLNPYSYAGDNPVTNSDSSGLYTQQQNAAIAGVASAFGVSSFSASQSAAIGGLAASFGVASPLITNLMGVSATSLVARPNTPTIYLGDGSTISAATNVYQQYANGVNAALKNPTEAAKGWWYTSPTQKVGIGISLFGQGAAVAGGLITGGGEVEGAAQLIERSGFKFTPEYYKYLWETGRPAPGLIAREIMDAAGVSVPDRLSPGSGFVEYAYGGWRLVVDPVTNFVRHLGK